MSWRPDQKITCEDHGLSPGHGSPATILHMKLNQRTCLLGR